MSPEEAFCFVCNVELKPGDGRYVHGDWVLCITCHQTRTDELPKK